MIRNCIKEIRHEGFHWRSRDGKVAKLTAKLTFVCVILGGLTAVVALASASFIPDPPFAPDEPYNPPGWLLPTVFGLIAFIALWLFVWAGSLVWQIRETGVFKKELDE